jgi:hypothetical protein
MPRDKKRDYEVGFGRPPRHTRFKKGQSGNPKGRLCGAKNLSTLINDELNQRVIIADESGQRKITKREAIVKQLVNRSATGDWRAVTILLDMVQQIERRMEATSSEASALAAADEEVIELLRKRFEKGENE